MRDPFSGLSEARLARLNDYQWQNVYFRPRDEDGMLQRPGKVNFEELMESGEDTHKELFWDTWRERGEPEERIAKRWARYERKRE